MKRRETPQVREFLNLPLQRRKFTTAVCSLKVKENEEEGREKKVRPAGAGVKGQVKESIGNHIRGAADECKNAVIPEIIEILQVRAIIGRDMLQQEKRCESKRWCPRRIKNACRFIGRIWGLQRRFDTSMLIFVRLLWVWIIVRA